MAGSEVITDTSPLIYLDVLGHFSLLQRLFGTVLLPGAVYQEVAAPALTLPGAKATRSAIEDGWLLPARVRNRLAVEILLSDLHRGEAEVIVLAQELSAKRVLLDDRIARNRAKALGLTVTGTIGLILLARRQGIPVDLRHDLDTRIQHGFRISSDVYEAIIRESYPPSGT